MAEEEKLSANLFKKGEEFLSLYRKVESFTQEILRDNERLRYHVATLEQELENLRARQSAPTDESLVEKIGRLEREKDEILARYRTVEKENVDFAKRYVEIEAENNNLANLYVASYQLHSTLDFREVLQIVKEIIINLIGGDRFAIYLFDAKKEKLIAIASEGVAADALPTIGAGEGIIGRVMTGSEGVSLSRSAEPETASFTEPMVCIPLKIKDAALGAIAIYGLLEHKKEFSTLDIELFNLLGGHAAMAIFGSKLYSESKRKLTTIQGFLELLKPE